MSAAVCPKGHPSSELDFCSECGAKIAGSGPPVPPRTAVPACPDCEAPRSVEGVVFCEVCGFNFLTGAHGEIPVSAAAPAEASTPPAAAQQVFEWCITVSVDAALREASSPEPPAGLEPFTFAIEKPVNLIGRHSSVRAIDPEIALDFDDAVSHRHAILTRMDDGALVLRDIGSSNGTELNGAPVEPMTDHALADGDQVTLGHWTKLNVQLAGR